jgi:hypothetical protein
MKTFADRVNTFNKHLNFKGDLPAGIRMMNPFRNKDTLALASAFYQKFYHDYNSRYLILGINPGRFGAGVTGIPFTDPKRLSEFCGMNYHGGPSHEPSSVFIYEMITAFGGPEAFYSKFYIHSVCPLGFTAAGVNGREINYNYYDSRELISAVEPFITWNIEKQLSMGVSKELAYCFGTGKNEKYLSGLNEKHHFFRRIVPLEHPRYIMQYKSKEKQFYIDKYLQAFGAAV